MVYQRGANDELQLESASFGGGRFKVQETGTGTEYKPNYFLTDHLGSTRAVINHEGVVQDRSDYYSYGLKWEYPGAQASDNRWLYNGKELQTAGLPDGVNYLDYGARMYIPRIARWSNMDKLSEKYLSINPFAYCLNNPLIFVDPDGKDVHITITAKAVGTTQIRLIGSEDLHGAPKTVEVPVYLMTVTDDVTSSTSKYLVTRDGPMLDTSANNGEDSYGVMNTAFEPKNPEGNYEGVETEYPEGMKAYVLKNKNGSYYLSAEPNGSTERSKKNKARGVMIHVGGEYTGSDARPRVTGSFGCFTLAGAMSGNAGAKYLETDISWRQKKNNEAKRGTQINVKVKKRNNVDWEWEVDKDGKKKKE